MKLLLTALLASILIGCGGTEENTTPTNVQSNVLPDSFFAKDRPHDVQDLAEVKKTAKKGDEVTFLARIGGRKNASFVPTLSMMIVADPALKSCEVMSEEEHCATPEDYCCENRDLLRAGLGTIRFMNDSGDAYPFSVEGRHGLELLKFVVITGIVHDISENGNFIVDASKVWVGGKPYYGDLRAGSGE
ncbi:MAG: hypothetical protein QGI78_00090 [Phycisphaerales bacterium]|jgi:hypothetical protein|nr:hypothetical protein [Phycisphaerales bacterium]